MSATHTDMVHEVGCIIPPLGHLPQLGVHSAIEKFKGDYLQEWFGTKQERYELKDDGNMVS
eukprot:gene8460-5936_t